MRTLNKLIKIMLVIAAVLDLWIAIKELKSGS